MHGCRQNSDLFAFWPQTNTAISTGWHQTCLHCQNCPKINLELTRILLPADSLAADIQVPVRHCHATAVVGRW